MNASIAVDWGVWLVAVAALAVMFLLGCLYGRLAEGRAKVRAAVSAATSKAVRRLVPAQREPER